jgi:nucleotide-binding universal stress UspA family protein
MFDSFSFFSVIAIIWVAIGFVLAVVMGRRGHNGFGWLVTGTLLGPFGIVLAVDASRHTEQLKPLPVRDAAPVIAGTGPVDVLVGADGSPESEAAMVSVVALLGDRLGRLTLATVVPYGDIPAPERQATDALRGLKARAPAADLAVLHGHPSAALRQCAVEGGYQLIVVGTRGKGLTRGILGSAATELARDCGIPVMLVGERQPAAVAAPGTETVEAGVGSRP